MVYRVCRIKLIFSLDKPSKHFFVFKIIVLKSIMYLLTNYCFIGDAMSIAAREFAEDPCASAKRSNMVRAARNLLSAVTRLLILADMVDVHLLLKSLRVVSIKII